MSDYTSSFVINESSNWGRYITAARDYEIGDIILDEAPLLIGPSVHQGSNSTDLENDAVSSVKTCLGCFKVINDLAFPCFQCGWPICCVDCSEEPFHKRYECQLFKNNLIAPNDQLALDHLNVIRACLMYKDQENSSDWKNFTALSSHLEEQTDDFKEGLEMEIRTTRKWINEICKLEVDRNTIGTIIRTFIVNGYALIGKDENGFSYRAKLVYKMGSLFVHSCSPNAEWTILPSQQNGINRWHLRIYAHRNISCSDAITIPYVQDFLISDTATRQKIISKDYHFHCQCERCVDPTEFNFYTSSVKCSSCGDTTLLPDDLTDESSPWTCAICGDRTYSTVIKDYIEDYQKSFRAIIKSEMPENWESCLEMLINSSAERNLTSNHRVITITLYYWLTIQKFKDLLKHGMESQLKFVKIMERATKCLKVFRMFMTSPFIVSVELVFANAIASFYFKTKTLCHIEYNDYSPEEKRQIITAVYTHMKIAVQIMEWNPFHECYSPFRNVVLFRFKFWERQYQALNGVQTVDIVNAVEDMTVQDETSSCLMSEWPSNDSHTQSSSMLTPSVSVVGKSTNASELIIIKPDVSLLSHYDFYFTN